MAGREHQAQQVVADIVVERRVEIRHRLLPSASSSSAELLMLALEPACSRRSDRSRGVLAVAMSHAPGLSGTPDAGHCLECGDQRILRQFLGLADITRRSARGRR